MFNGVLQEDKPALITELSRQIKNCILFLSSRPDLISQFQTEKEEVWNVCEQAIGTLTTHDKNTLVTLYDLFVAPGNVSVIYPKDKELNQPVLDNWHSPDQGFPWPWSW